MKYFIVVLFIIPSILSSNLLFSLDNEKITEFESNEIDSLEYQKYFLEAKKHSRTNPDSTIKYLELALDVAKENQMDVQMQESLYGIGFQYNRKGEKRKALEYFEECKSETKGNSKFRGHALRMMGDIHRHFLESDLSLNHYQLSQATAVALKDTTLLKMTSNSIGGHFYAMGEYDKALEFLIESANYSLEKKDSLNYSVGMRNIALMFIKTIEYNRALEYNEESKKYAPKDHYGAQGSIYSIEGSAFAGMGDHKDAIVSFRKSLEFFKIQGIKDRINAEVLNLAKSLVALNQYNEANSILSEQYPQVDEPLRKLKYAIVISEIYFIKNQCIDGEELLQSVHHLVDEVKAFDMLRDFYHAKGSIYSCLKKNTKAQSAFVESRRYTDSIYLSKSDSEFRQLETKYQTQKKEDSIQILSLQNDSKAQAIKSRNWSLVGALLLVALLTALAYWYRKYLKTQEALNELLQDEKEVLVEEKEELETEKEELEIEKEALVFEKSELESINAFLQSELEIAKINKKDVLDTEVEVKHGSRIYKFKYSDIRYIEANQGGCDFYAGFEKPIWEDVSLTSLELSLPTDFFIRCHKSFIANKIHIESVGSKDIILNDGVKVSVGRAYKKNIQ